MNELVFKSSKGNPVTNSLIVAETFEKNHRDVLESIKNLVAENSAAKFFHKTTYENRGKHYPMYLMTRDGLSFLGNVIFACVISCIKLKVNDSLSPILSGFLNDGNSD